MQNKDYSPYLIQTKLYKPQISQDFIRRTRLEKRLNQGLDRRLILVSAPAGFGKTTLVAQWLESCGYPSVWLSLNESDGDLVTLLTYLIAAIRTLYPDACQNTWDLLKTPQLPVFEYLAANLINELCEVKHDFILVLDDYYRLYSQPVHQLIHILVESMPSSIHLVLITRADPPLPLATLRAGRKILELRANALRFNRDEIQAFSKQSMGLNLDTQAMVILEQYTEGWVVGLRLAALPLRDAGDLTALLESQGAPGALLIDYLVTEVLSHQPEVVQEIMLRSSILDRFCASLLDALQDCKQTDEDDLIFGGCQETLEWMERKNLFLISLDNNRTWYRFHHLFQDLLKHRLQTQVSEETIASLHLRASDWFAEQGLVTEALQHAQAGDDIYRAARLVEQHRHILLNQEDWRTLVQWLNVLPEELVRERPALLLAKAWYQQWLWYFASVPPLLNAIEALIDQDTQASQSETQIMRGELNFLRCQFWFAHGDGNRCFEYAKQALDSLPPLLPYVRGSTYSQLGYAYQMAGEVETGVRILEDALAGDEARDITFAIRVLLGLTSIYYIDGDLYKQEQVGQHFLKQCLENGLALSTPWAYLLLGVVYYQQNRLAEAINHFSAVTEHPYQANVRTAHECFLHLALAYQAQGSPEKADQVIQECLNFALEARNPVNLAEARSFQSRLALLQGNKDAAIRWARGVNPGDLSDRTLFTEIPRLTFAQVMIAQGTTGSLRKAIRVLDELLAIAQGVHSIRHVLEILGLQALAYDALDENQKALTLLQQSLDLAQKGGFLRVYVDQGQPMNRLLSKLWEQGVFPAYVRQILVAFPSSLQVKGDVRPFETPGYPETLSPLTDREHEILALLAQRLSDKEIAQELHISSQTVRKHTSNLYAKLQVSGRREAVYKATNLGLLSSG